MKKRSGHRMLAGCMAVMLIGQSAVIPVEAGNQNAKLPEPVFSLDFENLSQNVGETVVGEFKAATGETITVHDTVT